MPRMAVFQLVMARSGHPLALHAECASIQVAHAHTPGLLPTRCLMPYMSVSVLACDMFEIYI